METELFLPLNSSLAHGTIIVPRSYLADHGQHMQIVRSAIVGCPYDRQRWHSTA